MRRKEQVEIKFWTDFVCPFCYVTEKQIEIVLEELNLTHRVDFVPMSFELNPDLDKNLREDLITYHQREDGMSKEEVIKAYGSGVKFARSHGLEMNLEAQKMANTHDAHRLYHYAKSEGKGLDFFVHVQDAHFLDGAYISDHEELVKLATEVGLDAQEARDVLGSNRFGDDVAKEFQAAITKDIQYVPHFELPSGKNIEGVISKEDLKDALAEEFDLR